MKMKHPAPRWRDWWRLPRVMLHLLKRPADLPRYLVHSLPSRHTPLELGVPWWSFGAVDAVAGLLRPDMQVFEYGSGGSSIFLARRTKHVTCVEDSEMWTSLVRAEAVRQDINNLEVLGRPFDFNSAEDFGESGYLTALDEGGYDVIVVDGHESSAQLRPLCFARAEARIKPGGFIVLDDSWRYPQVVEANNAVRCEQHKGVGYCRRGVTSTSLFFY